MPKPKAPACVGSRHMFDRGRAWSRRAGTWPCHPVPSVGFPIAWSYSVGREGAGGGV